MVLLRRVNIAYLVLRPPCPEKSACGPASKLNLVTSPYCSSFGTQSSSERLRACIGVLIKSSTKLLDLGRAGVEKLSWREIHIAAMVS
jgi:hypothetical protein